MNQDQEPVKQKRAAVVVHLDAGDYTVKKLPLLHYSKLLKAVGGFSKFLDSFDSSTVVDEKNEKFLRQILVIISDSMPEVAEVIQAATKDEITADYVLNNLDAGEVIDLLLAIYEVNGLERLFKRAKKAWASRAPQAPKEPTTPENQAKPSENGSSAPSTSSPVNTDGPATTSSSPFIPTN